MAKFARKGKNKMQAISTAALPDIVFMLLFFFMVTTVMKDKSALVRTTVPKATEVKKLENKSLVSHLLIGQPLQSRLFGSEPRIQLNDVFADVEEIRDWVSAERNSLSENDQKKMMVSLKVDRDVEMGIVTDVKLALRKASALKINYSAAKVLEYED